MAIIVASAVVVCLSLLFKMQWDTDDGEPLLCWDWSRWTMRPWAPPEDFRRWFVRVAPILVVAGLVAFSGALLLMR